MKSSKGKMPTTAGFTRARKGAAAPSTKQREKDPVEVGNSAEISDGRCCACVCACVWVCVGLVVIVCLKNDAVA